MKTKDFYGAPAAKADTTKAQAIAFVRALEEILAEEVRDKVETVAIGKVGKFVLKDQFRPAYSFRAYGKKAKK